MQKTAPILDLPSLYKTASPVYKSNPILSFRLLLSCLKAQDEHFRHTAECPSRFTSWKTEAISTSLGHPAKGQRRSKSKTWLPWHSKSSKSNDTKFRLSSPTRDQPKNTDQQYFSSPGDSRRNYSCFTPTGNATADLSFVGLK